MTNHLNASKSASLSFSHDDLSVLVKSWKVFLLNSTVLLDCDQSYKPWPYEILGKGQPQLVQEKVCLSTVNLGKN